MSGNITQDTLCISYFHETILYFLMSIIIFMHSLQYFEVYPVNISFKRFKYRKMHRDRSDGRPVEVALESLQFSPLLH